MNLSKTFAFVKYFALYPVSFFQKDTSSQGIWLIDERESQSAEDNSYHLFAYIRKQYPELRIYYVINEFSNQKEKVKPLGDVVNLFSWKHFMLLHRARVLLSTDSFKNLAFPCHKFPGLSQNTHNVFLQHGIAGNKTLPYYKERHPSFSQVITSNDNERNFFIDTYHFNEQDVTVTGLARFDQLRLKRTSTPQYKILIASTWRTWLKGQRSLYTSKYFYAWSLLIKNVRFSELLEKYDVDVYFQPHFNMMKFINEFEGISDRIHIQGKGYPLQEHIKTCDLLITDYSGVMYDFFYQEKPVVCYMFDRDEWEKQPDGPPHIDFDKDLPADITSEVNELIDSVQCYLDNKFMMKPNHQEKIDNFFKYRDHNNCERIYQSILQAIEK